jgi:hypothetical protein
LSERFLLYTIDDGEWHTITEIAEELEWPTNRVIEVTKYLAQGRFIHYDEQTANVKLQPWVKKFPRGEWGKFGKRSTGTVIIPADGNVTLQKTAIHNCLETEIEADFMVVDENLVELLVTKSKKDSPQPSSETSPTEP